MKDIKSTAKILREGIFDKQSPLYLAPGKERYFPSHTNVVNAFRNIKDALFVYTFQPEKMTPAEIDKNTQKLLTSAIKILKKEIEKTLWLFCDGERSRKDCMASEKKTDEICAKFIKKLPEIQKLVLTDIKAAFDGDPAATDPYQILLCYPGPKAVCYQRLAHFFYTEGVQILPRIITEHAHASTGIDIHAGAKIGKGFFIDHGTGVVIGETCVIGDNVKIYQGVTLGAKSFALDENGNPVKGIKRHPNIEDDVTIYANATILGDITVGKGSIIGANSWVTKDVKSGSVQKGC
ncbi:serine O-acetyltransferase [Elusimicrobium posterum]|uniref:serine O-acetyltransferase EpsC n=1 Tax=Elusimicrobium posterum TaxID=3116653 RepID=UPI003C7402B3